MAQGPLAAEVHGEPDAHHDRLVVVHGFTQTGRSWLPVVRPLLDGHQVVLVDAPGHGDSADVRADLARGGDLLTATAGAGTYVGYSMGGRLCLHAALAHPHLVERLVLVSASPGLADDADRAARRTADDLLATQLEQNGLEPFLERWLAQPLFATLPAQARGLDERRRNTAAGLAASLRVAGTGTQRELWSRLHELRMPVLLVTGALDRKFTAIAAEMAGAIGERATVRVIPRTGHAVPWERPAAFVAALREWLDAA
jgi:2-succinyl-6-hydroxy-2,4-cyclohexadiene-1-carboxylate synthase